MRARAQQIWVCPAGVRPEEPRVLQQAREDPQEGHLRQGGRLARRVVGGKFWAPGAGQTPLACALSQPHPGVPEAFLFPVPWAQMGGTVGRVGLRPPAERPSVTPRPTRMSWWSCTGG